MEIILWTIIGACAFKGLLVGISALNMKVSPYEHIVCFCMAFGFSNSLAETLFASTPKVLALIISFVILYIASFIFYYLIYVIFTGIFFFTNVFHGGTIFSRVIGCIFNAIIGVATAWAVAVFVGAVAPSFEGGFLYNAFVNGDPIIAIFGK